MSFDKYGRWQAVFIDGVPLDPDGGDSVDENGLTASGRRLAMAREPGTYLGPEYEFEATGVLRFKSDFAGRRLAGRIVTFNEIAPSQGRRWMFAPGSITWSDVSRVALNRGHDLDRVIGVAEDLRQTRAGIDAVFRIARTAEGDEVLQLAEDGALSGFSIEPQITDFGPHPNDRTVMLVTKAQLRGVAVTPLPAVDSARISAVFSRDPRPGPDVLDRESYELPPMPLDVRDSLEAARRAPGFVRARPSKTVQRLVTNRATGATEIRRDPKPDRVPGAVTEARIKALHRAGGRIEPPADFDQAELDQFWLAINGKG